MRTSSSQTANLTFDFQVNGQVITKTASVAAHSRATFNVRDLLGVNGVDCAVHVKSSGALIIVERPMYFSYKGMTGGHDTLGANATGKNWFFAEGTTRQNASDGSFETYLKLANFSDVGSTTNVTYMLGTGQNVDKSYGVPAHTVIGVNVNSEIGLNQDVSIKVAATNDITAERVMYFNHGNKTGGSVVVGTDSAVKTWYFAEGCTQPGFEEWITLQNATGSEAHVTLGFMLNGGDHKDIQVTVPAKTRGTYRVSDYVEPNRDVSCKVTSDVPVVAERPMYFLYHGVWDGGHDNIGEKELSDEWYLAEGTTRNGFEEWVTIQNPSINSCGINCEYYLADGTINSALFVVPAFGRITINVNSTDPKVGVGPNQDVSVHILADVPVAVERPMYFSYGQGWTGGHVGSGYPMIVR